MVVRTASLIPSLVGIHAFSSALAIGTGENLEADAVGEVLLTSHYFGDDLPVLFERGVAWVHNFGTGVDQFPLELLSPDQVLTCSPSPNIHSLSVNSVADMPILGMRISLAMA